MRRITTLYRATALTVCVLGTALAFGCGGGDNNAQQGPAPTGRASTTIWTDSTVIGTNQGQPVYRIATVNNADGSVVTYYGTRDAANLPVRLVTSAHNAQANPNNPTAPLDPNNLTRVVYDTQGRAIRRTLTNNNASVNFTWTSQNQVQPALIDANNNSVLISNVGGINGVQYTVTTVKKSATVPPASVAHGTSRVEALNVTAVFNAFAAILKQTVNYDSQTVIPAIKASRVNNGVSYNISFGGQDIVGAGLLVSVFLKANPTAADVANLLGTLPVNTVRFGPFLHAALGVTESTNVAAVDTVSNPANPVFGKSFTANNPGLGGTGSVGLTE